MDVEWVIGLLHVPHVAVFVTMSQLVAYTQLVVHTHKAYQS